MAIRYSDNLWPRRRIATLVKEKLTEEGQTLVDVEINSIEDLVTDEGEFAAMVKASGRIDDVAVHCAVGFVLFDRWYARISGLGIEPSSNDELEQVVRKTLLGAEFLLGNRPRRYRHCVLENWRARSVPGLQRELVAPDQDAIITTWPAMPTSKATGEELLARNRTASSAIAPLRSNRLDGVVQNAEDRRLAVLSDGRYLYAAQITHRVRNPRNDETFEQLCRSIAPLPMSQQVLQSHDAMSHWAM